MALKEPHAITALLFHRPPIPPSPTKPAHLTPETTTAFQQAVENAVRDSLAHSSSSSPSSSPTTTVHFTEGTTLDGPSASHIALLSFLSPTPLSDLRHNTHLQSFSTSYSVELCLLPTRTFTIPKKLAVFDMDSTLIQQEVIDLLAAHAGVEGQVSSITARAMNGELDFSASLRERVGLLRGLDESVFETLKERVTLSPGADVLVKVLKKRGVKTALLSGGFVPLARWVGEKLGIDHVYANELEVDGEGKLTGRLKEGCIIVDGGRKRELLREIAEREGVGSMDEVLAVGDGANDLPMLGEAGLGVAVNAKERVQREAPCKLNGETALLDVLYLVGLTGEEIDEVAGI